jgi:SulP family sulfate permease
MAYSTSALYFKTGGDGKVCSFIVAGLLGGFLLLGPEAINYFPRPLAGCLLLHLGAVLLYESLVETWRKAVDMGEYLTIWTICLSMTIIGFMVCLCVCVFMCVCV